MFFLVDDSPTGDLAHTHTATHHRDQTVTSGITHQASFEDAG
jgi:hypothetical protein